MATPDITTLANVAIAAGANDPSLWERVKNYCLNAWHSFALGAPDDVDGVGAALIAGGVTEPVQLEQIGTIVMTYPFTRNAYGQYTVSPFEPPS